MSSVRFPAKLPLLWASEDVQVFQLRIQSYCLKRRNLERRNLAICCATTGTDLRRLKNSERLITITTRRQFRRWRFVSFLLHRVGDSSRPAAHLVPETDSGLPRRRCHRPHVVMEERPGAVRPHPPPEARTHVRKRQTSVHVTVLLVILTSTSLD